MERRYCSGFRKYQGAKIHIKKQELCKGDEGITLKYAISVGEKEGELWYRFPADQEESISYEVADGVIVTLLPFALRGGYDIYSEIPMSERLWFQLTGQVIPQLALTSEELWNTELHAPLCTPSYTPDRVATAMSCGVDSFTTFFEHTHDMPKERWKIDLLTFFQNGAHHSGTIGHSDKEDEVYAEQLAHVRRFCETVHYPLLDVASNLDAFLSAMFWNDSYHYTHSYRNAGFVLLLQKKIRTYYYAGAYDLNLFSTSLWDDPAHYEKWLLPNLSTDCTSFFSVATSMDRIEKMKYIAQFPETYDHLLVCYAGGENCGTCVKCVRQLLTLDYLGLLDRYQNSFSVEEYRNNKTFYERRLLVLKKTDPFLEEVYQIAEKKGVRFSIRQRLDAECYRLERFSKGVKSKLRELRHK